MFYRVCGQGSPNWSSLWSKAAAPGEALPSCRPCLPGTLGGGHEPPGFLAPESTCPTKQLWPVGNLYTQLTCRGADIQPAGDTNTVIGTLGGFSIEEGDVLSLATSSPSTSPVGPSSSVWAAVHCVHSVLGPVFPPDVTAAALPPRLSVLSGPVVNGTTAVYVTVLLESEVASGLSTSQKMSRGTVSNTELSPT